MNQPARVGQSALSVPLETSLELQPDPWHQSVR